MQALLVVCPPEPSHRLLVQALLLLWLVLRQVLLAVIRGGPGCDLHITDQYKLIECTACGLSCYGCMYCISPRLHARERVCVELTVCQPARHHLEFRSNAYRCEQNCLTGIAPSGLTLDEYKQRCSLRLVLRHNFVLRHKFTPYPSSAHLATQPLELLGGCVMH